MYAKKSVKDRPSVQSCPVHISLMEKHWKILLHSKVAYDLRVCHDLTQVIWASSRSLEGKVPNLCLLLIFFVEKHWKFSLHTKVAYDLRVCPDFVPRSFGQLRGVIICELAHCTSSL